MRSAQVVHQSGLPVFHYHEGNQKGQTFGERLANAYAEVFEQGYEAVISVGNDSPELHQTDWQAVVDILMGGQCVIGPSLRGGAYLIGITRRHFSNKTFQQLPWQTRGLLPALSQFCTSDHVEPHLLQELRDVNTLNDVLQLKNSLFLTPVMKCLLLWLFRTVQIITLEITILPNFLQQSTPALRAPPLH